MASLGNAFSKVVSADFLMAAGLVAVGSVASQMVTNLARDNIVDVDMAGGDALYAMAGAVATMAFLPMNFARPLALGMVATGAQTAATELGVV